MRIVFGIFLVLALTADGLAISMRHDTPNVTSTTANNPYVAEGAKWDSVGFLELGGFVGTGSLVKSINPGEFKILTAAHNVDTPAGGGVETSMVTIWFGDNTSPDGSTADFAFKTNNIVVNPKWQNGDGTLTAGAPQYDFAVLTFTAADIQAGGNIGAFTSTLTPMNVSDANPVGKIGTSVGYGLHGTGDEPFEKLDPDGVRRAGHNTLDAVSSISDPPNTGFTIRADFDSPAGNRSSMGSSTPLGLESSTASGDSGGPIIVDFGSGPVITGVLNGGFNAFASVGGNETDPSEYGDVSLWAWVGDPMNRSFLTSNGIAIVPEPSAFLLLGLVGVLGLSGEKIRKRFGKLRNRS